MLLVKVIAIAIGTMMMVELIVGYVISRKQKKRHEIEMHDKTFRQLNRMEHE